MKVLHFRKRSLSSRAGELIQFDVGSIRQVVAARQGRLPDLWLADPDQYEVNGRILRDSTSPRLLAYSTENKTLYVTDGCNACAHRLEGSLSEWTADQLRGFAEQTGIRLELLEKLAAEEKSIR